MKSYSNMLDHVPKMAVMPIYNRKSSPPEPVGRLSWNLELKPFAVSSNYGTGLTLSCFIPKSNLVA